MVNEHSAYAEAPVFQAGVSETRYLPPAMVGQWSVRASRIQTDNARLFPPLSNDLWVLEQGKEPGGDGWVRLSNPVTGASSQITVTASSDARATFYHVSETELQTYIEQPTLKVEGNRMVGETRIERIIRPRGFLGLVEAPPPLKYRALYRIEAERIGEAAKRLIVPEPELEIAPLVRR